MRLRMKNHYSGLIMAGLAALLAACQASPAPVPVGRADPAKIKFNLDDINADGLRGPADGLVAVSYEFCVPRNDRVYRQLERIDASIQINPGASGRIGCTKDEALGIGNTGQPGWRGVVLDALTLAGLCRRNTRVFL